MILQKAWTAWTESHKVYILLTLRRPCDPIQHGPTWTSMDEPGDKLGRWWEGQKVTDQFRT